MFDAVKQIQNDHQNLDKVLTILLEVGTNLPSQKSDDMLSVLSDAIYYILVFPEKFHHPMEEKILFPLVRDHRPDIAEVLDRLKAQHEQGDRAIRELQAKLRELEKNWTDNRKAFAGLMQAYVLAQRAHISLEESEVLRPIKDCLSDADRTTLNSAYGVSSDPLFGENLATGFEALLKRITG